MNFEIITTADVDRAIKRLSKKYKGFDEDIKAFREDLKANPHQGVEIAPHIRKVRMAITAKGKGKAGGARVITFDALVSEQGGKRPVLVIQNDKGNTHSPTLIVATITTKLNKKSNYFPTHYIIRENSAFTEPSVIMLEQIRTIDKERVIEYLGKISQRDMSGIDRALMTSLSLNSENTVIKYVLKD